MVFFVFSGILGPSGRFSPTRQIPPADRWERWGESGGLVKSTTGPKMSENLPKFPCRLYSHAGGLHNPEGQVSAVASPYWLDGRVDGWMDGFAPKKSRGRLRALQEARRGLRVLSE